MKQALSVHPDIKEPVSGETWVQKTFVSTPSDDGVSLRVKINTVFRGFLIYNFGKGFESQRQMEITWFKRIYQFERGE